MYVNGECIKEMQTACGTIVKPHNLSPTPIKLNGISGQRYKDIILAKRQALRRISFSAIYAK